MIVVPFCSLVLSVIIAHTVLGPIGWKIGTFISDIVYAGISGSFRVVFGAIFGFVYDITFRRVMKDSRFSMKKVGRSADTTSCFFQTQE